MKKYFVLLAAALLALAACEKNAPIEEPQPMAPTLLVVDFAPAYDAAPDTKAVKKGWENGDVVYIFFNGITGTASDPKYLKLSYDAASAAWQSEQMGGLSANDLIDAEDKRLTAVYLPFAGNATVSYADGTGFTFTPSPQSLFWASDNLAYTIEAGTTEVGPATLSLAGGSHQLSMHVPEGFVQFFLDDTISSEFASLWLYEDHMTPSGVAAVTSQGAVVQQQRTAGSALPGYLYDKTDKSAGESRGWLFSGILAAGARGQAVEYSFLLENDAPQPKALTGTRTFYTGANTGRAVKFPPLEGWTAAASGRRYNSTDYSADNSIYILQKATKGAGIDIILMGDAYSDRLIDKGAYDAMMRRTMEAFFSAEPYTSFRDHFNVYCMNKVSKHEGYWDGAQNALGTYFRNGSEILSTNQDDIYNTLMPMVVSGDRLEQTLIIVVTNDDRYAGRCTQRWAEQYEGDWGAGAAIAYIAASTDDEEFIGLVTHEAGGHGFAKLADEYSYEENGEIPADEVIKLRARHAKGWRINIDVTYDPTQVLWKDFITDTRYASENIGVYQGGYTYLTGVWRPTENSKMRYNDGEFNAPSRYAIWRRIHKLAYGSSWNGTYKDFVQYDLSVRTPGTRSAGPARGNAAAQARPLLAPPVEIPYE